MFKECSEKIKKNRFKINKWSNYIDNNGSYNDIFRNVDRNKIKTFLEIGTQNGGSSQVLSTMFPNAKIYTIDINPLNRDLGPNIISIKKDATIEENLKDLPEFDIILDDGSHSAIHQKKSFVYLFKNKLKMNGMYIVEDLEHSFQNWWKEKSTDLNFFDFINELTLYMNAKQSHVDGTNKGELKIKPNYYSEYLFNISIYQQIICFTKKKNPEINNIWL